MSRTLAKHFTCSHVEAREQTTRAVALVLEIEASITTRCGRLERTTTRQGLHAGLARPLSADGRHLAYYNVARDRLVLVDLRSERQSPIELPQATRSGYRLDTRRFVAAGKEQMFIVSPPSARAIRLMRGSWLPRAGVAENSQLILLTQGRHRRVLRLVRMNVISAD